MYKTSVPWRSYAHLYIIHSNRIIHNSICAFRYKLGIGHDKTAIALWPEMSKTTRWNVWSRLHAQWFYFMYHVHILFITSLFVKFNAAEQQEQKKLYSCLSHSTSCLYNKVLGSTYLIRLKFLRWIRRTKFTKHILEFSWWICGINWNGNNMFYWE